MSMNETRPSPFFAVLRFVYYTERKLNNKNGGGLGTYSSLNRKCVSETRVGYRVGQGFHFRLFQKQCGGGL